MSGRFGSPNFGESPYPSSAEVEREAMSGREARRMRRDARRRGEKRLATAISILLLSGMAGVVIASEADNDQSCEGSQDVPVKSGDTLDGLKYAHVEVPDGSRVDLDSVSVTVLRPYSAKQGDFDIQGLAEVDTSSLREGDTVVMPQTCQ